MIEHRFERDGVISIAYNGDCMEGLKMFGPERFDLAIPDIPYGIGVGKMPFLKEQSTTIKQKNGSRIKPRKRVYEHKEWDDKPPDQVYFNELIRISKSQIIWGVDYVD